MLRTKAYRVLGNIMIDKRILITCPERGGPVSTGFRAPIGTDITFLKGVKMQQCPSCGGDHIWKGEDAYWDKEVPATPFWERLVIMAWKFGQKDKQPNADA
jgi:hypothetical protein